MRTFLNRNGDAWLFRDITVEFLWEFFFLPSTRLPLLFFIFSVLLFLLILQHTYRHTKEKKVIHKCAIHSKNTKIVRDRILILWVYTESFLCISLAHTHNIHNVVKCVHSIYHCCSGEVALYTHTVLKTATSRKCCGNFSHLDYI